MDARTGAPLVPLTRREQAVLETVMEGWSTSEAAARLGASPRTVESHVSSILRKYGVTTRIELRAIVDGEHALLADGLPARLASLARDGPLRGREVELARILAEWDAVAAGTAGVVVVSGEPGIGKSRLAVEAAAHVRRRGVAVVGCTHDERNRGGDPVARLIADLALPSDDLGLGGKAGVDRGRERRLLVSRRIRVLLGLAARRPLLVVVDDIQWATASTWELVEQLGGAAQAAPVLLLATMRECDPPPGPIAAATLRRMRAARTANVITLVGLGPAAAAAVVRDVNGAVDASWATRHTGGNPLFLRQLAAGGPTSASLSEVVRDRLDRAASADPLLAEVVDVLAATGEPIGAGVVAAVLGRPFADVWRSVRRGVDAGLLIVVEHDLLAFTHDVVGAAAYELVTLDRRLEIHRRLADVLADVRPDAAVRHRCLAAPALGPDAVAGAIAMAVAAGDRAAALGDHDAAAAGYAAAVPLLEEPGASEEAARTVRLRHGRELVLLGDAAGREMVRAAARAASRQHDAVALADALLALEPMAGGSTSVGAPDAEFILLAEAALAGLPPVERARRTALRAALGIQFAYGPGDMAEAERLVRQAVEEARTTGDPMVIGRSLLPLRFLGGPFDLAERAAVGHELVALGDRHGIVVLSAAGREQLAWCAREAGDLDAMDRWWHDAGSHVPVPDVEHLSQAVVRAYLDGDLLAAHTAWDRCAALATRVGLLQAFDLIRIELADVAGDDLGEDASAVLGSLNPRFSWLLASAFARDATYRSDLAVASDLVATHLDRGIDTYRCCHEWPAAIAWWTDAIAGLGSMEVARRLAPLFEPLAGRLVESGAMVHGSVDRVRAVLALTAGAGERAVAVAEGAVSTSRTRRTPFLLARELVVLAAARRATGHPERLVRAARDEALAIADARGAGRVRRDVELLGLSATPASAADVADLTAREAEILELVATGATNRQVAASLGISSGTVRKHLEHAFAKLGVSTRTGAVAQRAGQAASGRAGKSSAKLPE